MVNQELVQKLISKKVKLNQNRVRKIHQLRKKSLICLFEIVVKPPKRYAQADVISFSLIVVEKIDEIVLRTYEEVMKSKDQDLWLQAMEKEMIALKKNNTWKLVDKPKD